MKRLLWFLAFLIAFPAMASAQFTGSNLSVTFRDTATGVTAGGLYRIHVTNGQFTIEKNDAANGGFGSMEVPLTISGTAISMFSAASTGPVAIYGALTTTGLGTFSRATDSTSPSTGALVVSGGLGLAKSLVMTSGQKLYLDSGGDTYIYESAANVLDTYVGGGRILSATATALTSVGSFQAAGLTSTLGLTLGTSQSIDSATTRLEKIDSTTIGTWSIPSGGSATSNFLNITGTFPAVRTAPTMGVVIDLASAGSSTVGTASGLRALYVNLGPGYTGADTTFAVEGRNATAGTGQNLWTGGESNRGTNGGARATTIGHNAGLVGNAQNSSVLNIGGIGLSTQASNSPLLNGGLAGLGFGATVIFGSYSGCRNDAPTITASAAVIADVATSGCDLVNGYAAGSIVYKVGSIGQVMTPSIGPSLTQTHTLPAVASDIVAVLAASQTFTNKTISGASNTLSNIANASLTNSTVTVNGTSIALGASGTLTLASSNFANQGTTTTVLHGNASGNPSFAAVSLAADVTSTLPIGNGGTNSATALSGSSIMVSNGSAIIQGAAGTSVTLLHGNASGAPTYSAAVSADLNITTTSCSSQAVTAISAGGVGTCGSITDAFLSGQVGLTHGGTGASLTASNGGIFYSTGSAGAILSGTATARQALLSGANTTPAWSAYSFPATAGTSGLALVSDGTNFASTAIVNSITGTANQITASAATGAVTLSIPSALVLATSVSVPALITASGAMTVTPAAGSNFNVSLSTTGDFAVNTNQLYVDTSIGGVGIGTTAPVLTNANVDRVLHVKGSAQGAVVRVQGASNKQSYLLFTDSDTAFSGMSFGRDFNTTGANDFFVYNATAGRSYPDLAVIASGNFGVATSAPDKAVEINSSTGANLRLTYNDSNGTAANYSDFAMSSGGNLTVAPSGGTMSLTGALVASSTVSATSHLTATNCSDGAGAAACSSASAGSVVIDAAATTVVVSTTAVTANSQIILTEDSSLGTKLGITCNTQSLLILGAPKVTARTATTSFTISIEVAPTATPLCISYAIIN